MVVNGKRTFSMKKVNRAASYEVEIQDEHMLLAFILDA